MPSRFLARRGVLRDSVVSGSALAVLVAATLAGPHEHSGDWAPPSSRLGWVRLAPCAGSPRCLLNSLSRVLVPRLEGRRFPAAWSNAFLMQLAGLAPLRTGSGPLRSSSAASGSQKTPTDEYWARRAIRRTGLEALAMGDATAPTVPERTFDRLFPPLVAP